MNGEEINRNRIGCDCVSSSETTPKAFMFSLVFLFGYTTKKNRMRQDIKPGMRFVMRTIPSTALAADITKLDKFHRETQTKPQQRLTSNALYSFLESFFTDGINFRRRLIGLSQCR